jgi:membrane-associated phospholipid phosphatase
VSALQIRSAALAVITWVSAAAADAAPVEWRSKAYYAVNGAVTAALIGGNALTGLARRQLEAGGDTVWFPGDAGLRGRCSPEAAQLSDVAQALTVALPPAMELGGGLSSRFVNAQVVYTQALFATTLLTSATKVIFRRPRPFSYRKDADCVFQVDDSDANLSFFSGHSSSAFSAAFAGSFLMSERVDLRTRSAIWGAELALAGATANLRARAGKHYYSDILVGALVGAGVGLAVPALHGADEPPRGSDLLAGLAGLVVGVAGSQLVAVGAEAIDEGALSGVGWNPLFVAGAQGLSASGRW